MDVNLHYLSTTQTYQMFTIIWKKHLKDISTLTSIQIRC